MALHVELALAASVLTALASAAIAALATAMTYVYVLLGCMYMRCAVRSCVLYWTALLLLCSGLVVEHFVSPAKAKLVSVRVSSARRRTTLGTLVTRWAVRCTSRNYGWTSVIFPLYRAYYRVQ